MSSFSARLFPAAQSLFDDRLWVSTVLDRVADVVLSLDAETHELLYLNQAAERLYGQSLAACRENPQFWLESIIPSDRDRVARTLQTLPQVDLPPIEYTIERPDGTSIQVCQEFWLTQDEAGNPGRIDSIIRETPAHNPPPPENLYCQPNRQLDKLAANLPGAIYQYIRHADGSDEFSYISPGCREIYELEPEAIEQDSALIWAVAHSEDLNALRATLRTSLETLSKWQHEWRIVTPSGGIKWLSGIAQPEKQVNGDIVWDGLILDISDRKQIEAQLQRSLKELADLKLALDLSAIVAVADRQGDITYVNDKFCEISQYSREELLGQNHRIINSGYHPPEFFKQMWGTIARGQIWTGEIQNRAKDGTVYWVDTTIVPFVDDRGKPDRYVAIRHDITDRKRSEAELQDREQFLRSIYDGVEQLIFVVDVSPEGIFHYAGWNSPTERATGIANEQVQGKTPEEVFGLADGEALCLRYSSCLRAGTAITYEECLTLQGQETWWLTSLKPLQDERGRIYRLVGTTLNINDRRAIEKSLQQSQQLLQLVMDTIPQYIFWKDRNSMYLGCNQKFAQVAGVGTPEKIIGKTDYDLAWKTEEADWYRQRDRQVMDSNTPELGIVESRLQADGSQAWLETNKAPLHDSAGKVIGILGTFQDISDRKRAEEALRQSALQLQQKAQREALLNHLADRIRNSLDLETILDTTVEELRKVLSLDCVSFSWYGTEDKQPTWEVVREARAEALSRGTNLDLTARFLGQIDRLWNETMADAGRCTNPNAPISEQFCQNFGCQSVLVLPIHTQGGKVGLLCLAHCQEARPWNDDEVKLLEAAIAQLEIALNQAELYTQSRQQSQELAQTLGELQRTQTHLIQSEKMSSLGQMVAGIAHEINNPVNFIYGNLSHVREYSDDLLGLVELYQKSYAQPTAEIEEEIEALDLQFIAEDLPNVLHSMQVGAERIRDIVKSLRIFSRLDEAEMKEVDLHENIESSLTILKNRLKAKHDRPKIEVIKHYGSLPFVECYIGQLNQVFMNILVNAIDALEAKLAEDLTFVPTLTICTDLIPPQEDRKNVPWVKICLRDNGQGVPEGNLAKIFDPFYTTKPIGQGTGLGLAISYQIVCDRHGGKLSCQSSPEKGTEFAIEIPIHQPKSTGNELRDRI